MKTKNHDILLYLFGIAAFLLVMTFKLPVEGLMLGFAVLAFCLWKWSSKRMIIPIIASALAIAVGLGTFFPLVLKSLEQGAPASDYWLIQVIFG